MSEPKILIAEVTALAGTTEQVRDVLRDYGRVVRQEAGNRTFSLYQVEGRPERFVVHEVYEDDAAFQAHLSAPENAEVNRKLGPLVEGGGSGLTFLIPVT